MPVQQAEKNEHFDVIIIGAEFSGRAVADRFAELRLETHIALVDALEVGQGVSGLTQDLLLIYLTT